ALQANDRNFSIGLAQINVRNLRRLGLTLEAAFEPCVNLAAMQSLLIECFDRASTPRTGAGQRQLRQALSCYYSGDFSTGFRHGYVLKVIQAARDMKQSLSPPYFEGEDMNQSELTQRVLPILVPLATLAFQQAANAQGFDKVNTTVANVNAILATISIAVVTIAIIWAGFKMIFQGARLVDVANVLIGGTLIGGAGAMASYIVS
ncbi:MAG TPA: TrbC/VirB2 family protein, partial [Roseateles sp.]|nr:TrbC/VirB2 family protein [Roseateles sp.]